jgi:hypothetical protein
VTPNEKNTNLPPSPKNGDDKRRYFKKEVPEARSSRGSASEEKGRAVGDEEGAAELGVERANSEYLKLHDKLSFLEFKIAEMKKNLQRKKEEKVRRRREEEGRREEGRREEGRREEERREEAQRRGAKGKGASLGAVVTQVPEKKELHSFERNPYSPRHSIYYVSEVTRAYADPKSLAREHLHTSLQVMAYFEKCERPTDEQLLPKRLSLPRRKGFEGNRALTQPGRPSSSIWTKRSSTATKARSCRATWCCRSRSRTAK